MAWTHPTGIIPKRVAIVALGPSSAAYVELQKQHEPPRFDEVWSLNTGHRLFAPDVLFHLDDLIDFEQRWPDWAEEKKGLTCPIITSHEYAGYPQALEFPLQEVVQFYGGRHPVLHGSSLPYLLAYAGFIGVEEIALYGVDYSYPDLERAEQGRSIAAFWVGRLEGIGVHVYIESTSELLDTHRRVHEWGFPCFYGYVRQPMLRAPE